MAQNADPGIMKGLIEAMRAEHEGQHFYLMAARSMENKGGRETFELLAREEQHHFEFLKAQYRSLSEKGEADSEVQLGKAIKLDGESPIFSPEILDRLWESHIEMSALSVAIQLEMGSMKHYASLAREASDPAVSAFFMDLSEWERGHYRALLRQQEELKEEYWGGSRFSPF